MVSNLALAVILLDGGMRTRPAPFASRCGPLVAGDVGVLILGADQDDGGLVVQLDLIEGLLIGAIVGSTDAAASSRCSAAKGLSRARRLDAGDRVRQ